MSLLTKSALKQLELFKGLKDKEKYTIVDHMGRVEIMTGREAKAYISAHSRFIKIEPEQQVSELSLSANENKN